MWGGGWAKVSTYVWRESTLAITRERTLNTRLYSLMPAIICSSVLNKQYENVKPINLNPCGNVAGRNAPCHQGLFGTSSSSTFVHSVSVPSQVVFHSRALLPQLLPTIPCYMLALTTHCGQNVP